MVALIRDITPRKRLEEERLANERVQHEMRIARGVQLTMLPDRPPKVETADIAARIEFCEDIGGDLFDFSHPRSGKLGVSIGDVSAHGVGPAIVMSSAKAMLNTLEQYTEDLEHMFFLLNNLLEKTTEDDRFITMFYGLIDQERKTMEYVNAGHDPPIVYRPSKGVFEELQSTGMLLGILPSERFRLGDIVHFYPGDLMLLTTDGIWEAADPDGGDVRQDPRVRHPSGDVRPALPSDSRRAFPQGRRSLRRAARQGRSDRRAVQVPLSSRQARPQAGR